MVQLNAVGRLAVRLVAGTIREAPKRLSLFNQYARAELYPPTMKDLPAIRKSANSLVESYRTQKWKQLTVREAALNSFITMEIMAWFFVGIIIARYEHSGSFYGYVVPAKTMHPDD